MCQNNIFYQTLDGEALRKDKVQFSLDYPISLQSNDTVPFHGS